LLRRLFLTTSVLLALTVAPEPLIAWFKLAGTPLTASATGWLLLVKWVSAAVLALALLIGARLTRKKQATAGALAGVTTAAAAGALSWLAAAATVLRVPPTKYFVPYSITQVFRGCDVEVPDSECV